MSTGLELLRLSPTQKSFLERKKIGSLEELLQTYPIRYIPILPIEQWQEGEEVLFCGEILRSENPHMTGMKKGVVRFFVSAWGQQIDVSVFFQGYYPQFPPGKTITVCGTWTREHKVRATWTSFQSLEEGLQLYPVYSLPVKTRRDTMIRLMKKALPYADQIDDRIPQRLREKYRLPSLKRALAMVHRPKDEAELAQGVRALKYEEFLCFHAARLAQAERPKKTGRIFDHSLIQEKIDALPFVLSKDQSTVLNEILSDLGRDRVMYRLVQGDVGCGKTVVAALSLYACALSGKQAALLAPTELLARQHLSTLQSMGIEAGLYCGALKVREKKKILKDLKDGKISVVVGTHALFQEGVEFESLGLVIADEQHRFGVRQRRALIEKGVEADVLLLSATPIPRTAAHFLYGDIDLSTIKTKPPGRKPVLTRAFYSSSMKPVLGRILEGIEKEGRQVYVVTPAVEDCGEMDLHSAELIYEGMSSVLKDRCTIGLLHGKMKAEQKEGVMAAFAAGEIQILVSTTVIEVGIDVSNATMMVIYDAHRFGLSTLHQLRGRCARGTLQGECYLLSSSKTPQARERLSALERIDDGFELARLDLQLRGPGDLLGTRQSGLPAFILGDASTDLKMMEICARDAQEILDHPEDMQNHNMLRAIEKANAKSAYLD